MKEHGIDSMKYRKSTHLAGIDVETIISEKGKCILTIKDAYYATGIDVSGNKTDGYFLEFQEDVKPMVANSINRKTIASIVKEKNQCTSGESRKINNWIGFKIELGFDENVKMLGKTVGGIRVKPGQVVIEKKPITDAKFDEAVQAINAGTFTKEALTEIRILTIEQKQILEKL